MSVEYKYTFQSYNIFWVDDEELESIINTEMGVEGFCIRMAEDLEGPSLITFNITADPLGVDQVLELAALIASRSAWTASYCTEMILQSLCSKSLIPPGEYLVRV